MAIRGLAFVVVLTLTLSVPAGPALAGPGAPPRRGDPSPVPPPPLPAWVIQATQRTGAGDVQQFFDIAGSSPTLRVGGSGSGAPQKNSGNVSPDMQVELAICWSAHDYAHLSEHVTGAIDAKVSTVCDRPIDRVFVHGYLWRSSDGSVWFQVGDQPRTNFGLWYVDSYPATGCPGGSTGYYYTSSGYHEVQWGASIDWGNSWSDKVSWIRCGGPY